MERILFIFSLDKTISLPTKQGGLDFGDAAGFLELVVRDVELDLIVPVDKARHFGCVGKGM
jgi:hypothetical protein